MRLHQITRRVILDDLRVRRRHKVRRKRSNRTGNLRRDPARRVHGRAEIIVQQNVDKNVRKQTRHRSPKIPPAESNKLYKTAFVPEKRKARFRIFQSANKVIQRKMNNADNHQKRTVECEFVEARKRKQVDDSEPRNRFKNRNPCEGFDVFVRNNQRRIRDRKRAQKERYDRELEKPKCRVHAFRRDNHLIFQEPKPYRFRKQKQDNDQPKVDKLRKIKSLFEPFGVFLPKLKVKETGTRCRHCSRKERKHRYHAADHRRQSVIFRAESLKQNTRRKNPDKSRKRHLHVEHQRILRDTLVVLGNCRCLRHENKR